MHDGAPLGEAGRIYALGHFAPEILAAGVADASGDPGWAGTPELAPTIERDAAAAPIVRRALAGPPSAQPLEGPMLAAYLQLAGAMILAGATVTAAKPVVAVVPVYVFGALRFAIAAAILVPMARGRGAARASRRDLAAAALLAFFGAFLFTVLILEGVARTSALDAALITSTIPAATLLLSALLLRERLTLRRAGAVVLATAGIAVIALPDAAGGAARSLVGNLLVLGAVFSEALFTVLAKRLGSALAPVPMAAVTTVSATAMFLPSPPYRSAATAGQRSTPAPGR